MKRALFVALIAVGVLVTPGSALGAEGDLVTTFNGTGKLSGDLGAAAATRIYGSVMQQDGKLVVVGELDGDGVIARFTPDGSLDPDFGETDPGITVVDSGTSTQTEQLRAVAIQDDGKIVAVGDVVLASGSDFVLARVSSTGEPDGAFDGPGGSGDGVFRIAPTTGSYAGGTTIAASGTKVIFGGAVDAHSIAYQLNSDGTLDTTGFGSPNGYLAFDFPGAGGFSFVNALAVQPGDGKIIAVGNPNSTARGIGVARITTSGALDTASFNNPDGLVVLPPPEGYHGGRGADVALAPGGQILVGGSFEGDDAPFPTDVGVAAVTSGGALDTAGFGGGTGYAVLPLPGNNDGGLAIEPQPNGEILLGGSAGNTGAFDVLVARFGADGVLDTSFAAPTGYTTTDFGGENSVGNSLALSSDGVAYTAGRVGSNDFGIAAFRAFGEVAPPPPGGVGPAPTAPARRKKKCKKRKHRAATVAKKKCKKKRK